MKHFKESDLDIRHYALKEKLTNKYKIKLVLLKNRCQKYNKK